MAKRSLSATQVAAITSNGTFWVSDSLYLQVRPQGSRSWLFRYERAGKSIWLGLGAASAVPLSRAKELAVRERAKLLDGIDPRAERQAARVVAKPATEVPTFDWCASQYVATHEASWKNSKHRDQWVSTLATYAGPIIGKLSVDQIEVDHVLRVLRPLWITKVETASRLRGRIEMVLGWAAAKGFRPESNPARWKGGALEHLLPPHGRIQKVAHHQAVPYPEMPKLMARLAELTSISSKALMLTILTACRTGEVLGARWTEVDLEAQLLVIPAERMKGGVENRVPLSDAAVELLRALPRNGELVFAGARPRKPLSNMSMLQCLRGLRDDGATVHGTARSSFRDWAAEMTNHPREIVEGCLAHATGSAVELAYLRTDHLAKRRLVMADWSAFCTGATASN